MKNETTISYVKKSKDDRKITIKKDTSEISLNVNELESLKSILQDANEIDDICIITTDDPITVNKTIVND